MNFSNLTVRAIPRTFQRNGALALASVGLFAAIGSIGLVRSDEASASEACSDSDSTATASCRKQNSGGSALIPPGFNCDLTLVRASALLKGRSDLATLRADTSLYPFQLADKKLQEAIDKVCVEAKHLPVTTDLRDTSEKIHKITQNVLSQYFQGTPPLLEEAFVTLEGINEYCTRKVAYDYAMWDMMITPGNKLKYETYAEHTNPVRFLVFPLPATVCFGGSILERDMASSVGIKARYVYVQHYAYVMPSETATESHGVTEFLLPGGYPVYCDWSFGWGTIAARDKAAVDFSGKADAINGLPRNAASLELFLRRHGDFFRSKRNIPWQKVSQVTPLTCLIDSSAQTPMMSLSYSQWKEYNLLHDRTSSTFCGYDDTRQSIRDVTNYCTKGKRFYTAGR